MNKLTVCMVYKDLGKMRCSTAGQPAVDKEFLDADHYVCMPNKDAEIIFNRMKTCEGTGFL